MEAEEIFKKEILNYTKNSAGIYPAQIYSACIIAASIQNSTDKLCQKIEELEKAVRGGLE